MMSVWAIGWIISLEKEMMSKIEIMDKNRFQNNVDNEYKSSNRFWVSSFCSDFNNFRFIIAKTLKKIKD